MRTFDWFDLLAAFAAGGLSMLVILSRAVRRRIVRARLLGVIEGIGQASANLSRPLGS